MKTNTIRYHFFTMMESGIIEFPGTGWGYFNIPVELNFRTFVFANV